MILTYLTILLTTPDIVKLDTSEYLNIVDHTLPKICHDGSFIIPTRTTIFHFTSTGRKKPELKNGKVGGRGQAPNQFVHIISAVWDGKYYWVTDGKRHHIKQLNDRGNHVKTYNNAYFEPLIYTLPANYFGVGGLESSVLTDTPPYILPIEGDLGSFLKAHGTKSLVKNRFHKVSDKVKKLNRNYTKHYLALTQNRIFIMNEVEPSIHEYKKEGKKFESVDIHKAGLYSYKEPPDEFMSPPFEKNKVINWENSWSRIYALAAIQDTLLVAYDLPTEDLTTEAPKLISFLDLKGKPKKEFSPYPFRGYFLGTYENRFFYLVRGENEIGDPSYNIESRALQ